jgi:membrane fusion protein, macrolide-specific efflux system
VLQNLRVASVSAEAAPRTAARKKRGRWAVAAAVAALLLVVGIVVAMTMTRSRGSATSGLSTAPAAKRTINVTVSGSGSTVAANSVTVNPQISGTVKKLRVSLGQKVKAGQTLYTISSDSVKTSLLQAKASLLQSQQGVSNAVASYEQAENQLYDAKTKRIQAKKTMDKAEGQPATAADRAYNIKIATRQYNSACEAVDSAEIGVDSADLGLQAARASLKTARESYSTAEKNSTQKVVSAPSGGVITALPVSVGSAVSAGTNSSASSASGSSGSGGGSTSSGTNSTSSSSSSGSSITIADMSSLQVELTVSEVDIPKVSVGQKATVEFDAISGKTFSGTVKSILPNATTSSGVVNYTVYIKLGNIDAGLRTGMTATVDIQTLSAANVVTVPNAAVKTNSGTKYVVVVGPGGTTTNKTVTVGVSDDSYTQITSGITEGTTVSTGSSSASSSGSSTTKSASGGLFGGGGPPGGGGGPPSGGPGGN